MTFPAGTRLGPYEILSPLGAGGMGEVYRATDTKLGRDVVLPDATVTVESIDHKKAIAGGPPTRRSLAVGPVARGSGRRLRGMGQPQGKRLRSPLTRRPLASLRV